MKKIVLLIIASLLAISCVQEKAHVSDPSIEDVDKILSSYSTTTLATAPTPKEGYVTIGKLGDEIVCVTALGGDVVSIPRTGFTSHAIRWSEVSLAEAEKIDWTDTPFDGILENLGNTATLNRDGLLMFEDTPGGDRDYNDVIIHLQKELVSIKEHKGQYELEFSTEYQPIALGGALPVSVGFEVRSLVTGKILQVYESETSNVAVPAEYILCQDARNELFEGVMNPFFINTESKNEYKAYKKAKFSTTMYLRNPREQIAFNWFIEVTSRENKVRFYTADAQRFLKGGDITYTSVLMNAGTPFGIFLPRYKDNSDKNKDFRYMEERINIRQGYPNFQDWVDGKIDYPFDNPVTENLYQRDVN